MNYRNKNIKSLLLSALLITCSYLGAEVKPYNQQTINNAESAVVKFSTSWCGPCKSLAPKYKTLSNDPELSSTVFMESCDQHDIMRKYNVRSVPTCIVFKNGHVVKRVSGNAGQTTLNEIKNALKDNSKSTHKKKKKQNKDSQTRTKNKPKTKHKK